jgi:hypothetical protein
MPFNAHSTLATGEDAIESLVGFLASSEESMRYRSAVSNWACAGWKKMAESPYILPIRPMTIVTVRTRRKTHEAVAASRTLDDYETLQQRRVSRQEEMRGFPKRPGDFTRLSDARLLKMGATYHAAYADEQRHLNHPKTPKSHRDLAIVVTHLYGEKRRLVGKSWLKRQNLHGLSLQRLQERSGALGQEVERLRGLRDQFHSAKDVDVIALLDQRINEAEFQRFAITDYRGWGRR